MPENHILTHEKFLKQIYNTNARKDSLNMIQHTCTTGKVVIKHII